MLVEVRLHVYIIISAFLAESISLNRVCYRTIIIRRTVTCVSFRCIDPLSELFKIPTHRRLAIADCACFVSRWHGCIICDAHDVLSQSIQAMEDVLAVQFR
jgi:hypothetical protein